MKKLLIITSFFLFSCTQNRESITVQYNLSSGAELLSSSFFADIEFITLHGDEAPLFGAYVNMIIKDNIYYIWWADKVHLFDTDGKYLNSIGDKGRGPGEYLFPSNVMIEENGDVSVYDAGKLYTYSPDGRFLRSTEYLHKSSKLGKANDYNYHYYGHGSGLPYQLYITDNQNRIIDSCLTSSTAMPMIISPSFTIFENALNLCPSYGGEIYRLEEGKINVAYTFDFGVYAIPDEYYQRDYMGTFDFLMSNTVALKSTFFENQKYAILEALVLDSQNNSQRLIYGLLEKATLAWTWYYMDEDDFMNNDNLKYMDNSYVYFTAEPEMMKEAGLEDRFPILSTLDVEDGMVILRCKLRVVE